MKNLRDSIVTYLFPTQHTDLIRQFAAREVASRYRQSWLGTAWTIITPLLMLMVYTFVFRYVFVSRWPDAGHATGLGFALRLFSGLVVFNFFSECVGRAPRLILDQPNLVKKVAFPIEILPWVSMLTALFQLAVAGIILVALSVIDTRSLPASVIALPLVWLPLVPLCVGLGWLFAGIGTYVRDLGQMVTLLLGFLIFMSPVFYPVSALPAAAQDWMVLNPLALPMTLTRGVLLEGLWPDWWPWGLHLLGCSLIAVIGAGFFRLARKGFADVV